MKLILHIGSPKTGSTSLQKSLYANHDLLLEKGFFYPFFNDEFNHNLLSLLVRNSPPTRQFIQGNIKPPAYYEESGFEALNKIIKQIDFLKPNTVILSSEYFFYDLNNEQMEILKQNLFDKFDDVKIVLYIKNPVDYYSSMALQTFKASYITQGPYVPSYKNIIQSYSKHFSTDVIEFSSQNLYQDDIVKDFYSRYVPEIKQNVPCVRMNTTISVESLLILSKYQSIFYRSQNDVFNQGIKKAYKILQYIEQENKLFRKPKLKDWVINHIYISSLEESRYLKDTFKIDFIKKPFHLNDSIRGDKKSFKIQDLFEIDQKRVDEILVHLLKFIASIL